MRLASPEQLGLYLPGGNKSTVLVKIAREAKCGEGSNLKAYDTAHRMHMQGHWRPSNSQGLERGTHTSCTTRAQFLAIHFCPYMNIYTHTVPKIWP